MEKSAEHIRAKVRLHNYRFPKNKAHVSGEYAIVILDLLQIIDGTVPAECRNSDGRIVVTGNMQRLEPAAEYILKGNLVRDKKWGFQYQCESLQLAYDMTQPEDQRKFFSFFMSEKQIDSLFSMYDNPIQFLEQKDIGSLTKVKGIGPTVATRMCMKYAENIDNGHAYVALKDLGITKASIDKLIAQFGSADMVVDIIMSNPYNLISLVHGYGWERADRIALSRGFGRGCRERCIAYANFRLEKLANDDGNSRMPIEAFLDDVSEVCAPTSREQLAEWIKEETVGQQGFEDAYKRIQSVERDFERPRFYYAKEPKLIGLFNLRLLELQIAEQLRRIKEAPAKTRYAHDTCEKIITKVEAEQGFEYTSEQKRAIWNILDNNVSVLTGSAGSGKSSTLRPLVRIFQHYGLSVAQCALSGRASGLLTSYTGIEGKTIHRLLNYIPDQEIFAHNASNPLTEDVILLDETSMVGEELFLSLIKSIKSGAKLVMLGDIKQLPPMSVGNILSDCLKSGYFVTNTLTKIHRQAMRSGIISQSMHVCEGKQLVKNDFNGSEIRGELKDFKIVTNADAAVAHGKVIDEFKALYFDQHIPVDDIQIIVPVRSRGINSCRVFNAEIQHLVNGEPSTKTVAVDVTDSGQKFTVFYKPKDRVIITKNNYHARTLSGSEVAIFNGNMGHIVDLDNESMIVRLQDVGHVIIPRDSWNDLSLAYACTCHKLQGSQAQYVIISLDSGSYPLLMREWLYTAITRARKYCILVGQPKAINLATRVSNIKIKQTWLRDDLYTLYRNECGF